VGGVPWQGPGPHAQGVYDTVKLQPSAATTPHNQSDSHFAGTPSATCIMSLQAPSFTRNPHNGDVYSAYNKPEAVIDWLAHNEIEEDFVLILDADMIMRAPFIPEDLGAKEGTAISAYYGYLKVPRELTCSRTDTSQSATPAHSKCSCLETTVSACELPNATSVFQSGMNVDINMPSAGIGPLSCAKFRCAGRQQCAGAEACARGAATGGRVGWSQGAPRRPGACLLASYQILHLRGALSRVQASSQIAEQDITQQLMYNRLICRSEASS
jgi:hypothetical protein